jgi:hypothetical protein
MPISQQVEQFPHEMHTSRLTVDPDLSVARSK